MIENNAGKLPMWLAPRQSSWPRIVIGRGTTTFTRPSPTCRPRASGPRPTSATKRIKLQDPRAFVGKVPVILAVGRKEVEEGTVTIRRLGEQQTQVRPLADVVAEVAAEAVPPTCA